MPTLAEQVLHLWAVIRRQYQKIVWTLAIVDIIGYEQTDFCPVAFLISSRSPAITTCIVFGTLCDQEVDIILSMYLNQAKNNNFFHSLIILIKCSIRPLPRNHVNAGRCPVRPFGVFHNNFYPWLYLRQWWNASFTELSYTDILLVSQV